MELVKNWYVRRMQSWEHQLAFRSTDRVVRPFDWGVEWTKGWPFHSAETDPEKKILDLNRMAIKRSSEFFAYEPPRDFAVNGDDVQFTSAVETPYPENNTVHARYFPAKARWKRGNKAVVLLPALELSRGAACGALPRHRGIGYLGIAHQPAVPRSADAGRTDPR